MHPHRSSALDGAAAALTVARTRGVAVPLSWSWSHHPQARAWAAASARGDTFDRTPYPARDTYHREHDRKWHCLLFTTPGATTHLVRISKEVIFDL